MIATAAEPPLALAEIPPPKTGDGLDSLLLITPQRFFTGRQNQQGDQHVYAARTRIPSTLLQFFETATWPLVSAAASQHSAQQIRIDVGARMRAMWK